MKKRLIILLIFILSLVMRLAFLLNIESFWGDEATYFNLSRLPIKQLISGHYWDFPTHPFLMLLFLKFWSFFSLAENWLRLPSVLFSLISIFYLYKLSAYLFMNKKAALISLFLLGFSTYNIKLSAESRYTNLVFLLETASLYYFIKILNRASDLKNDILLYIKFILVSFLGIISDYSFFWLFFSYLFFLLYRLIKMNARAVFNKDKPLYASLILTLTLFLPWIGKFISSLPLSYKDIRNITPPTFSGIYETVLAFLVAYPNKYGINAPFTEWGVPLGNLTYLIFSLVLFISLLISLFLRNKYKLPAIIVIISLLPMTLSFLAGQKVPIFIAFNLLIVHLGLILLLVNLINQKKPFGIFLLIIYLFLNSVSYRVLLNYETKKEDWKYLYEYLTNKNLKSRDALIIYPGFNKFLLEYYSLKTKSPGEFNIIDLYDENTVKEDLSIALRNHKFQNICLLTYPDDTNSKIIEKYLITDYKLVTTKTFPQSNSVNCFAEASLLLLNHSIPGRNRTAIGGLGNLYSIR